MIRTERVVIVNAGGWGALNASDGDYEVTIDAIKEALISIQGEPKAAEVEVVKTLEEVQAILENKGIDTLIFMTRGMLDEARKIKKDNRYSSVKVIVLTGLIPRDEVVILDKNWLTEDLIRSVSLR